VPGEPVPDDAAGLRAANARLRAVVGAKDAEVAVLRAELGAERELRRRLELRVAELERRLSMDSSAGAQPDRRAIRVSGWQEDEFGTPTLSVTIACETIRLATVACDGQC
jgi:hypothetical protein